MDKVTNDIYNAEIHNYATSSVIEIFLLADSCDIFKYLAFSLQLY